MSALLEVVAAVILRDDGAFLLAQRPADKVYAGYWEFPGGKVEPGEELTDALVRELREELGIDVQVAFPWLRREFVYPHAHVRLNFFRVTGWSGEPHPHEGQRICWQRPGAAVVEPMLPANGPVLAALALPAEYAVTMAERIGVEEMLVRAEARLRDGLRLIQLRDRSLPAAERHRLACALSALATAHGARLMVNADEALAREVKAAGIHYPAAQLMQLEQRPHELLASASCHDASELERATRLGLDFVVVGPVKPTATHPGVAGCGWGELAALIRGSPLPVYAIGGLTPADMPDAWRSGAHGIAMMRASWSA